MFVRVRCLARSAVRFDQFHIIFEAEIADRRHRTAIGDEGMNLGKLTDPDRRGTFELRRIGNENDMPGIGDDGLGDLHFAKIIVKKRAIDIDRRRADHGVIDLELADEIDGRLADDPAVRTAHDPAGNDHLDCRKKGVIYWQR